MEKAIEEIKEKLVIAESNLKHCTSIHQHSEGFKEKGTLHPIFRAECRLLETTLFCLEAIKKHK